MANQLSIIKSPRGGRAEVKKKYSTLAAFSAIVEDDGHIKFYSQTSTDISGTIINYRPSHGFFVRRKRLATNIHVRKITREQLHEQQYIQGKMLAELVAPVILYNIVKQLEINKANGHIRVRSNPGAAQRPALPVNSRPLHLRQGYVHGYLGTACAPVSVLSATPVRAPFVHVSPRPRKEG